MLLGVVVHMLVDVHELVYEAVQEVIGVEVPDEREGNVLREVGVSAVLGVLHAVSELIEENNGVGMLEEATNGEAVLVELVPILPETSVLVQLVRVAVGVQDPVDAKEERGV